MPFGTLYAILCHVPFSFSSARVLIKSHCIVSFFYFFIFVFHSRSVSSWTDFFIAFFASCIIVFFLWFPMSSSGMYIFLCFMFSLKMELTATIVKNFSSKRILFPALNITCGLLFHLLLVSLRCSCLHELLGIKPIYFYPKQKKTIKIHIGN